MSRFMDRVRDLIGSTRRLGFGYTNGSYSFNTYDINRSDYKTWDAMRRGKAKGYELSGLMLKPLGSKVASWVLGRPPEWKFKDKQTEEHVETWWRKNHADVLRAYEEAVNLGDAFLVINSDLSVTVVPPHVVKPIVEQENFGRIIGWRITERYPNPESPYSTMTIVDEYTAKQRVRTIERDGTMISRRVYRNVIKKLPVIHVKNQVGSDEMFGRPEGEALATGLQIYNEVFLAALKGNIRQGRPTPVIQKMGSASQLDAFWTKFGRRERMTLPDGTVEEIDIIPFDPDQLMTLGGESEFDYKAPGSFSLDTEKLLGIMFYLIVQNTEIPEFVWGTAISASKASADSQIEPFLKWLEKKRSRSHVWLNQVAEVVMAYLSVFEPDVNADELPVIQWKPLTNGDGRLTLDTIIWAWSQNLIDDETAVSLMPVSLSNPKQVLERAKQEPPHVQAPQTSDNKSDRTGGKQAA
jgi:hypothetical protein